MLWILFKILMRVMFTMLLVKCLLSFFLSLSLMQNEILLPNLPKKVRNQALNQNLCDSHDRKNGANNLSY